MMSEAVAASRNAADRLAAVTMPSQIAALKRDPRGYPIPKFVQTVPTLDFRVLDARHMRRCVDSKICWICGGRLGRGLTAVIGPMCAVNRISSEPPSHLDCARYAARVCPFLAIPEMRRNDHNLPPHAHMAGIGLPRNPGVTLLWRMDHYRLSRPPGGGVLFELGEPTKTEWYREGRPATRAEVLQSLAEGIPALAELAARDGQQAVWELGKAFKRALAYVPAA